MITHHGMWVIARMLSRSSSKHSYIPSAYHRKHLLIPCPTNTIGGHILSIVSNKRVALPLTKARFGLERQRQTRAVWAKRTEYSIEQIRQSLQRLKITKIVRMQNLHNFRTIDSVFFSDTRLRCKLSIIDPRLSRNGYGRALVTLRTHALAFLETTLPVKKTLAQFITYEQLFICRLSNLPPPIVSIVLRKLAIVNTSSRKQEWTFVHSVVLHLIYQKFN